MIIDNKSVFKALAKGYLWNSGGTLISKGLRFSIQLFLVKLIAPEYFGAFAVANAISGFMMAVSDLGISSHLIHSNKYEHNQAIVLHQKLLAFNLFLMAFVMMIVLLVEYNQKIDTQILLFTKSMVSLTFISSINIIPRALVLKKLRFKLLNITEIASIVFGSILSVCFAKMDYPVLSLLSFPASRFLIQTITFQERRFYTKISAVKIDLRNTFIQSKYDMVNKLLISLTEKLDYLLLAFFASVSVVGVYELAFMLTDTIRQVTTSIVSQLLLPIFSTIQKDIVQIKNIFRITSRLNFNLVLLPLGILFCFSEEIAIQIGGKWTAVGPYINILSVAGIIHSVASGSDNVLRSLGHFKSNFQTYVYKTFGFTVPLLVIFIYFYGGIGACIAVLSHKLIGRIFYFYRLRALIGFSLNDVFFICGTGIASILCARTVQILLTIYSDFDWLNILVITAVAYVVIVGVLNLKLIKKIIKILLYERSI
jgi:teichuronic acid exporter